MTEMGRKKRGSVTAAELERQLATDAEYQARVAEQEDRAAKISAAEVPILQQLADAGVEIHSLSELRAFGRPVPPAVVTVLLGWLSRVEFPTLQDAIVRALANVESPFDVKPLLRLFESTSSKSLRWSIGNTLAELRPLNVQQWIIEAVDNVAYGRGREMLYLALARIAPAETAIPVLLRHLDADPGHVALGLAECGTDREAAALKRARPTANRWTKAEIDRAVRRIERRTRMSG